MKRKSSKFLSLLLAAVLLLSLIAPAALAAGTADTIYLRTAEDLAGFSRNCTLDSWSQGKTVYLEADIDLTGVDFAPIPTFGGTFEGQGHTISGLSITGSGNVRGLFRYIQPTGSVRDLHVSGSISPADRKNVLGGLAGKNQGTITMCSFSGTVSGLDSIGGIAGINEAQGEIINCAFSGSVTGEHYVGGIAGQNYGSIIQCENSGSINTTEVDTELDLDALNREQLNAAENIPVCTDIGGIAGFSSGILQSCVNTGAVGYAHEGYNIGGIVGPVSYTHLKISTPPSREKRLKAGPFRNPTQLGQQVAVRIPSSPRNRSRSSRPSSTSISTMRPPQWGHVSFRARPMRTGDFSPLVPLTMG